MQRCLVNCGLLFGDEAKGTTVEYQTLQVQSNLTVRFNGGAQAAHNIVLPDGRHHTFSQFGAATFIPDVRTLLSRFMLVNPVAMLVENNVLEKSNVKDAMNRMYIDGDALVTTPYHRADNRLRELERGGGMHGSCGMGISATVMDSLARPADCIRVRDLLNVSELTRKLQLNRDAMHEGCKTLTVPMTNPLVALEMSTFEDDVFDKVIALFADFVNNVKILSSEQVAELFNSSKTPIFEPAQGILLDENYGFHPYTTWTTCTLKNANTILNDVGFAGNITSYGVLRTFGTRHGPGPFVTEDDKFTNDLRDVHNTTNIWQRHFRCGKLDLMALKYSIKVNREYPLDYLSLTHVDTLERFDSYQVCVAYKMDGKYWIPPIPKNMDDQIKLTECMLKVEPVYVTLSAREVVAFIEEQLGIPINILSSGPTHLHKTHIKPI
jgi:adenylosuccinate synthase